MVQIKLRLHHTVLTEKRFATHTFPDETSEVPATDDGERCQTGERSCRATVAEHVPVPPNQALKLTEGASVKGTLPTHEEFVFHSHHTPAVQYCRVAVGSLAPSR